MSTLAWVEKKPTAAGGPPTGAAGGDLAGSYPNPTINTSATPQVAKLGLGTTATSALLAFPVSTAASGGIDFGTDTTFYRGAASTLTTDGALGFGGKTAGGAPATSTNGGFLGSTGVMDSYRTANGNHFRMYVGTEANPRLGLTSEANGARLSFGIGSSPADTYLARQGAGILRVERPSGGSSILEVNAATGQLPNLYFSENGTMAFNIFLNTGATQDQLQFRDAAGNDYLRLRAVDRTVVFPLMAADAGLSGNGVYSLSGGSAWDGGGVGQVLKRVVLGQAAGYTGGINSRTSGDVTDSGTDEPNNTTATFFQVLHNQNVFNTKGVLVGFQTEFFLDKPVGSTIPTSNYNEGRGLVVGFHTRNQGANSAAAEFNNTVWRAADAGAASDSGPARARTIVLSGDAHPLYADYASSVFGAGSAFINRGQVIADFNCSGSRGYIGTGIIFRGTGATGETAPVSGFKRVFTLETTAGVDIFCLDGEARMGFGRTTNQSTTLASRITVGYTNAGAASTAVADGINFGGDTDLYRSAANTLNTPDRFLSNADITITNTNGTSFFGMNEQSANVAAGPQDTQVRMYMKADKVVFVFNNGGTTRYFTLDLTQSGATATWAQSTTAP